MLAVHLNISAILVKIEEVVITFSNVMEVTVHNLRPFTAPKLNAAHAALVNLTLVHRQVIGIECLHANGAAAKELAALKQRIAAVFQLYHAAGADTGPT